MILNKIAAEVNGKKTKTGDGGDEMNHSANSGDGLQNICGECGEPEVAEEIEKNCDKCEL